MSTFFRRMNGFLKAFLRDTGSEDDCVIRFRPTTGIIGRWIGAGRMLPSPTTALRVSGKNLKEIVRLKID